MKVGVGYANRERAHEGGREAAARALEAGGIGRPDLLFAFIGGDVHPAEFLAGLRSAIGAAVPVVGGSAIGIITPGEISYTGHPCGVLALEGEGPFFRLAAVEGLAGGECAVGERLIGALAPGAGDGSLLVFYDSVRRPPADAEAPPELNVSAGLLKGLAATGCPLPLFGAGLMADFAFGPTVQFCGSGIGTQCAVGVVFSRRLSAHHRIMHGCSPLDGVFHRVTRAAGNALYEIDGRPVVAVIDDLYGTRDWRKGRPVDLLTIGRYEGEPYSGTEEDRYVNRLITGVLPDGEGIALFEPDITEGDEILFMIRDPGLMISSARSQSRALMEEIRAAGGRPVFGLYIDCAGRTALYSKTAAEEAAEVQQVLGLHGVPFLGFYSGVEIAPCGGRSRGLDWTGVLLVFVEGSCDDR
ncbi:MAG: FIST N-terminal domain-containing protein [Desulfobacterales bacterium]